MTTPNRPPRSLPPAVVNALRCSVCAEPLHPEGRSLRCVRRHSFDLAKQGYVNLLRAGVDAGTADTGEMVAARADFLATGRYDPLVKLLARVTAATGDPELVVDAGAGTGHYLAGVLDRVESAWGLALDVSAPALRRAAKAHPRIGAVVWNLWESWPVADGVADVVLDVFAPRNAAEFHRVLRPGGLLAVATPGAGHLHELVTELGLLDIAGDKADRVAESLAGHFEPAGVERTRQTAELDADEVRKLVLMGPNAHHLHRDGLGERLDALTGGVTVTIEFDVSVLRRRG
ncbi:23S rRNA (guanine745-N1)-methyltransferase [Prauserella isguenensis]|uniref:23S rRNA (Guanine745-N1)-methyltransferase n=1 Tax=Prauserella isguenensis TaxID=1470180 RepID=A0A839S5Z0_9PSEU|nr:23S rRNA (guanine745-N1)-methyltransferase [Prauserella isguenensis]